jgi:hypothetical protein
MSIRTTTLSQELFDRKAKEAVAKTPIRKEVNLKEVEVVKDDLLRVGDINIPMSSDAFKGVCKAVGLPVGFDKTFSSAFGDKARQALVNRLKVAVQAKGNTYLSLVVNPEDKRIIGVQKDPRDLVSNQTFIDTSKRIIDKYGLGISDFSVSHDGSVVINTMSPKNAWGLEGLKDEDFYGGITFSNSPSHGYRVSPYLHRLICANGMIGTAFDETMSLGQMDGYSMEKFWTALNSLAERGFRPMEFEKRVRLAMNTPASLMELEAAHDSLRSVSDAQHKELEAWTPYHTTRARFHGHGIDTAMLSSGQKKGAKTGTTVWDLVNGITHFATHDNGFKVDDFSRRKLQVEASRLLVKPFDMANVIPSPF